MTIKVGDIVKVIYIDVGVPHGTYLRVVKFCSEGYFMDDIAVEVDFVNEHPSWFELYWSADNATQLGVKGPIGQCAGGFTGPAGPVIRNKYMREVAPDVWVDVYDVLYAWEVTDPCLQHLIKKALAVGKRGHKDEYQDLIDIRDSAIRAVQHYEKFADVDKS